MTHEEDYEKLKALILAQPAIALAKGPLFIAEKGDEGDGTLFDVFLSCLPDDIRQHYNCNHCRHFFNHYGSLVSIDEQGYLCSAVFPAARELDGSVFAKGINLIEGLVTGRSRVRPFVSSFATLGCPSSYDTKRDSYWTHFYTTIPQELVFTSRTLNAGQRAAVIQQNIQNVLRAVNSEYTATVARKAVAILEADPMYRGDVALGPARFLVSCYQANEAQRSAMPIERVVARLVATAPDGFCHPKSSMIGTLLDDLMAGRSVEECAARFKAKMAPSQYQRPQAAPSAGNIEQAERLVDRLGLAQALKRRFARLEELQKVWSPVPVERSSVGVFGHIAPKGQVTAAPLSLPSKTITWLKFLETVLPNATSIEALVPEDPSRFAALVTAAVDDCPPILAWDKKPGRNQFSWYYHGGADAEIKRRVLSAGGQYENVDIRASLIWHNRNDLDLHAITPSGEEIYFGHRRSRCGGWLDVDMNVHGETTTPVENIRWPKGAARYGHYRFFVENYCTHERYREPTPFTVEIEVNGSISTFKGVVQRESAPGRVDVAAFDFVRGAPVGSIFPSQRAGGSPSWGLTPGSLVKVNAIVASPNHWWGQPSNNGRHMFFILEGCRDSSEGIGRGFFPEMLAEDLRPVRATLEAYTATARIEGAETATGCGLGMSDQSEWNLTLRVALKDGVTATYKIDRWD